MGIKMAYIQIFIWGKWKNKFQTSSYNRTLLLRFIDDIDTKLTKRQKSNSMKNVDIYFSEYDAFLE